MRQNSLLLAVLSVVALAAFGSAAYWMLHESPTPRPAVTAEQPDQAPAPASESAPARTEPGPDVVFAADFAKATNEAARLRLLDSLGKAPWAKSGSPLLRECMEHADSPALREKALDVALELAGREKGAARSNVLRSGLASTQQDIRAKSFRLCRAQPEPALIDELLRAASGGRDERYLAIHALSALDDPRAQRCVLEAARDEGLPKVERARAIALLARSKLPEAVEFLKQLASSKESEFAGVALDALAAMQQNAPK